MTREDHSPVKHSEAETKPLPKSGSIKIRTIETLKKEVITVTDKMVIKRDGTHVEKNPGLDKASFMNKEKYKEFDLKILWNDTLVRKVYLNIDAASELNEILHDLAYRMDIVFAEGESIPHPEIGGFLLGTVEKGDDGFYVGLEKYVEAPTEKQDAYELEFGREAFVKLDNALEQNPNLTLLGWFHTHPGHGCFLSVPDKNIHSSFFNEPYQMALQIDTLSVNQDFAIYSWAQNNHINNARDRISNSWFSWEEVNDWRRRVFKRRI